MTIRIPLTELALADYLVADVTKPYAAHGSYLEIERRCLPAGPIRRAADGR